MTPALPRRAARAAPLLLAAALAAGCAPRAADGGEAAEQIAGCAVTASGVELPRALYETSGAAFSRRRPGAWWSHNDSGNRPELFLLDSAGALLATVRVRGTKNEDWEDMAAGPCAGGRGDCLYVAEIGDNGADLGHVTVYRVPEPAAEDRETAVAEAFHGRYPDGPRDAEGFFVLPDGRAYVVTKGTHGAAELYRFPLAAGDTATLEKVRVLARAPLEVPVRVTGAAATPDGRWIAVRTYVSLELYRQGDLLGSGAPALRTTLVPLAEPQGEAVALGAGGRVLLTSETRGGVRQRMSVLTCPMP